MTEPPHTLRRIFPPPHPEATPFLLAAGALLLAGLLLWHPLTRPAIAALLATLFFFRDPARVPPADPGAIVAAADGVVMLVDLAPPPPELDLGDMPRPRVATFLSVLNVHVTRMPADATVRRIAYRRGGFANAGSPAAEANECNAVALDLPGGATMAVVQIAGLIARRIVCTAQEGETVLAGSRFGIIRFGSRVDVYLPPGAVPLVQPGQTMVGGETMIARVPPPTST